MERKSDHGFRRLADEVRSRRLTEVAPLLGYEQDRTDRCRWRRDGSVLSVNESEYYDHITGCGGGGAIGERCATILPFAFPDNTPHWKWGAPALFVPGIFLRSIPLSKLFLILFMGCSSDRFSVSRKERQ